MNTSVIITKKAGEVPARGYMQAALTACPTCYGIVIQDKDADNGDAPILDIMASASSVTIDKMMETCEAIKDCTAVITLGKMTQDFNQDDDPMPYVFQQSVEGEAEPQNILAVFIEGDAPNYTKVGEGHTETYNLWEEFIFPVLLEKFEASADLPSFYDKLRTSSFQQSMLNVFGHRGVVVFAPLEGEPIAYGKNDIGGEFPWGTTSNTFSWTGESLATKAKAVVGKAKSRLVAITGAASSPAATSSVSTDDKGIHHVGPAPKTDTAIPAHAGHGTTSGMVPMKPPSKLQGNARNSWVRLFAEVFEGPMPVGHNHANFVVQVPANLVEFASRDVSTKDQVKSLGKEVAKVRAKMTPIGNDAIAAAHDEAVKINEQKPTIQDPKKTSTAPIDYLPDTSADERKKATEFVTELATLPKRPTALEVQRIESKWDKFHIKHGITFNDMLGWTINERKRFCNLHPNEAAIAMGEFALWCIDHGALGATEMELDPKKVEVTPPNKQVEVQPAAPTVPAAPVTKKSRLTAITGKAA